MLIDKKRCTSVIYTTLDGFYIYFWYLDETKQTVSVKSQPDKKDLFHLYLHLYVDCIVTFRVFVIVKTLWSLEVIEYITNKNLNGILLLVIDSNILFSSCKRKEKIIHSVDPKKRDQIHFFLLDQKRVSLKWDFLNSRSPLIFWAWVSH